MKISVIIITHNEANNIQRALESVQWADEIIVVDDGSTDNTVEICRRYTDKVFHQAWLGYGKQKQFALEKASGDWVLSLDADEEISSALGKEIQSTLQNTSHGAFYIPIKLVFYGKVIHHANGSSKGLRLFKRKEARFNENEVHEAIQLPPGKIGKLTAPAYHYSFDDVSDLAAKMNKYSSLSAKINIKRGKKGGIWQGLYHGWWLFFRIYIINGGFLDGKRGFILSQAFAKYTYYRYLKTVFKDQ